MAAALSSNQFLDLVRKSRLVDEKRLESFLESFSPKLPAHSGDLARHLVQGGLLTPFQVGQLLHGRWRGFLLAQGKYKLLDRLGAGGMGQVFLCEHVRMRRLVALKVLPTDKLDEDRTALERFDREARAAAALDHPNIVRAHDIDTDGRLHFLVMEYVDGFSLQEFVRKHGPLDVVRACHYIADAARGLQHAHEAGWVHRDVKPGNLLLGRDGTVKLLDMGLARLFADSSDNLTSRHEKKAVLGTADYVAPEQATNSSDVDVRADVYSLGATLYFLLTGRSPFDKGSITQKLIWHQTKQPEQVRSLRPDVPKELEAILNKMMAKKPVNRYQEPAAVEAALEPWTRQPIEPPAEQEMPLLCPALLNYSAAGASLPRSGVAGPPSTLRNHGQRTATSRKSVPPAAAPRYKNPWVAVGITAVIVLAIAVPVLMNVFGIELPLVLKFNSPSEPVKIHATPQPKDNLPPPPPKELPVPPKE
jgi:serine/threonine protein kinase